ncbi:MAG TPA: hypothetical protein VHO70_02225 [Chitinispirillaceae bacterium]|nr:hypothetical protein [Chitinispirillaceae bacterium]
MKKILFFIVSTLLLRCTSDDNPVEQSFVNLDAYKRYVESARSAVTGIRKLNFSVPVKTAFLSRNKLSEEFVSNHRYYKNMTIMMKQLGLLPDTLKNLEPYIQEHYSGFPAAYYITGTDSLVVIDPYEYAQEEFKGIVVHELTHALQDQNFNLSQDVLYPDEPYSHFCTDFYLARRCVAEGDATVAQLLYLDSLQLLRASISELIEGSKNTFYATFRSKEIPAYLTLLSYFPYNIGSDFVWKTWSSSGWNGVNALYYANRPVSTAEIITREKIDPVNFDYYRLIQDLYDNVSSVQFAEDDNYGPVMLLALISNFTDASHAITALGWQGDRLLYVLSDNSQWGKFLWSFKFNSVENALYCFQGLDFVMSGRTLNGFAPQRTLVTSDSLITFTTGTNSSVLLRNGETVFWMENIDRTNEVVSGVITSSLAKQKYTTLRRIEIDPEFIKIKKQVVDRIVP